MNIQTTKLIVIVTCVLILLLFVFQDILVVPMKGYLNQRSFQLPQGYSIELREINDSVQQQPCNCDQQNKSELNAIRVLPPSSGNYKYNIKSYQKIIPCIFFKSLLSSFI